MTVYRIYPTDAAGHFIKAFDVDCSNDEDACIFAFSQLPKGAGAEVWAGTRLVGDVCAAPTRPAKVLIAEDNLMLAGLMDEVLTKHSYSICGIATTVTKAVELAERHKPDFAIIDTRLANGGFGTDIPKQLSENHLGILYSTANVSQTLALATHGNACIAKPFHFRDLIRGLEIVAQLSETGSSTLPFPPNFQLLPTRTPPLPVEDTL